MTPSIISQILRLDLPHKSRLILAYLLDGQDTLRFKRTAPQAEIARTIGCHVNTVDTHIRNLKGIMQPVRSRGRARSTTYQIDLSRYINLPAQPDSTERVCSDSAPPTPDCGLRDGGPLIQEVVSEPGETEELPTMDCGLKSEPQLIQGVVDIPPELGLLPTTDCGLKTKPNIVQGVMGDIEINITPIRTHARAEENLYLKSCSSSSLEEEEKNKKYNDTSTASAIEEPPQLSGGPCEVYASNLPCSHTVAACKRLRITLGQTHDFPPSPNLQAFVHRYGVDEVVRLAMYLTRNGHSTSYLESGGAFSLRNACKEKTLENLRKAQEEIKQGDTDIHASPPKPKGRRQVEQHDKEPQPNRPYYRTFKDQDGNRKSDAERRRDAVNRHRQDQLDTIRRCLHGAVVKRDDGTWECGDCWGKFSPEQADNMGFEEH